MRARRKNHRITSYNVCYTKLLRLIWQFSAAVGKDWTPTVRPPRLGGDKRMGVFATRSPFRPNNIGLSSVRLDGIEQHASLGPILQVSGVDLLDNTPLSYNFV